MALLPTIPSSFAPRTPAMMPKRDHFTDLSGLWGLFAYGILLIVFVLAIGVFLYDRSLTKSRLAQEAVLTATEAKIDAETVSSFVHLRDRLNGGNILLKKHSAFSNFFTALQSVMPSNVRFSELQIATDATGATKVTGTGVAASFNTLAVTSTAFSSDTRIKDVIFSGIAINTKDNIVSFSITATLDPKLTTYSP